MRLYAINLGGGSGSGIAVYANSTSLPVSAADGDIAFTTSEKKLWAYDFDTLTWDPIGGFGALLGRSESVAISNGAQTVAVSFAVAMPSANYALVVNITNTTDADPQYLSFANIVKTASGFTVELNAPTDSANYVLEYMVGEHV